MKMREKKSKDEFQIPNKNRIKMIKADRKDLRNTRVVSKNLIESPENSDDEQYHEKLVNRGSEWWGKVNYRFFRELTAEQIANIMDKTTTEELLTFKHPAKELLTYFQERIVFKIPFLASPCFLKVLFRRQIKLDRYEHYQLVTFSFKQYEYQRQKPSRVIDKSIHLSSFRYPLYDRIDYEDLDLSRLELDIIDYEDNQDTIQRLLHYDVVNMNNKEEIDREIVLWGKEIEEYNKANLENWKALQERIAEAEQIQISPEEEIESIKKELRMTEVLLYFKRGHSDKTQQMLDDALQLAVIKELNMKQQLKKKKTTKIQKLKCLFQTDCKICFCTQSDDKNQVLYCDNCNTSFHQACYGVEFIQQEEKFFCQVCQFLKKHNYQDKEGVMRSVKKPVCQICCKLNFPMRQLQGHFYHITCLVLFDLVQIKNYKIEFKNGYLFDTILQKIVQNEMESKYCSFCQKQSGMKLNCSYEGCQESFHPICAYLNGVYFDLLRSYRSVKTTVTCPSHFNNRGTLNQVYLRRFFCDYKGTSNKTDAQFQEQYNRQVKEKEQSLQMKLKQLSQGVIRKGRVHKSYKCNQIRRVSSQRDRSEPFYSASKKESSDMASNPLPIHSETETDTRKLLRMMSEKNQ